MMHDETRAYAHALLSNAAETAGTKPSEHFARFPYPVTLATLRDNDDRNLPGRTGEPGDYEVPLLACAAILDELASRIASEVEDGGPLQLPKLGQNVAPVAVTSRDLVLIDLRGRVVQDGSDQADMASALLDYAIYRRDILGRAENTEFSSVYARLHRIDGRNHGGTATDYYGALLAASAAIINDLVAHVVELTSIPAEDIHDDLREFVRRQPTPAPV